MIEHRAEIEHVEKTDAIAPISFDAGYHRPRFAQERHEHSLKQSWTDFDIQERGT
jgi:hypothetical protein